MKHSAIEEDTRSRAASTWPSTKLCLVRDKVSCCVSLALSMLVLAGSARSARAESLDRIVDSVTAGEEQNERDHKLKGERTETLTFSNRVYRTTGTNGWFAWELKVQPAEPQELSVEFGGSNGRRGPADTMDILVGDSRVVRVRLNGPRQEYYPLSAEELKGKSSLTIRFQAVTNSGISGVHSVVVSKPPLPTIASTSKASSPRTNYQFIVNAVNDLREPTSSGDRLKKHFDWWPAKGTNQWVQYDFAKPTRVSAVEVYWFDDTGIGDCRLPKAWQVLYRRDGEWKPVTHPGGYSCEGNRYNRTTFDAVETDGLRLDVQTPDRFSSGVLQWRVE
jgi:hypothetical protein